MKTNRLLEWSWGVRPATTDEFDAMMTSLDKHLANLALRPNQRSLNAAIAVSSVLGLSGTPILGGSNVRGEPFSPVDLLARVHDWYSERYGEKAKIDFSPGSVVMSLHGNMWEMKMPKVWGSFQVFIARDLTYEGNNLATTEGSPSCSYNALCSVEGMTQAYADKLVNDDLKKVMERFVHGYLAVSCLDQLRGHDFFEEARGDYRHSVYALLTGREFGKARWDSSQCAEKIFKGLLGREHHDFPRSGAKGHDIAHLGSLVKDKLGVVLLPSDLTAVHCSPAVRYGEQKSTLGESLASHDSLVRMLNVLAEAKIHHAH